MKAPELSRKYATAVFSLALESWLTSLKAVNGELTRNAELAQTLQDRDRLFAERQKALDAILPADSSQQTRNLLYTMLKEGDMALLGEVISELERMVRGGPLVQVAQVTTAVALSDTEMDQFASSYEPNTVRALSLVLRLTRPSWAASSFRLATK